MPVELRHSLSIRNHLSSFNGLYQRQSPLQKGLGRTGGGIGTHGVSSVTQSLGMVEGTLHLQPGAHGFEHDNLCDPLAVGIGTQTQSPSQGAGVVEQDSGQFAGDVGSGVVPPGQIMGGGEASDDDMQLVKVHSPSTVPQNEGGVHRHGAGVVVVVGFDGFGVVVATDGSGVVVVVARGQGQLESGVCSTGEQAKSLPESGIHSLADADHVNRHCPSQSPACGSLLDVFSKSSPLGSVPTFSQGSQATQSSRISQMTGLNSGSLVDLRTIR